MNLQTLARAIPDGRCKKAPRCLKSKFSENIKMKKPSHSWVSEAQERLIAPSQWRNGMKQRRFKIEEKSSTRSTSWAKSNTSCHQLACAVCRKVRLNASCQRQDADLTSSMNPARQHEKSGSSLNYKHDLPNMVFTI